MVPFRDNGHLTETEIKYNKIHSSSRIIIERSLDSLKERFRNILDILLMTRTDLIAKYIIVCCILHNICLLHNDRHTNDRYTNNNKRDAISTK